jgi:epoxyqueuosine reductase
MEKQLTGSNATLQDYLLKLDVDLIGVASISELKGTKLEEMAFRLLPETHSIIVLAMELYREVLTHSRPEKTLGQASLNDLLERHQEYLNGRLTKAAYDIAKISHQNGFKALPLPAVGTPTDSRFLEAVFSYKHAARAAGLGYIGRSSLLITPDFGPRVRLACCLTEAALESKKALVHNLCSECDICINNCPASALNTPQAEESYVINKFACSTYRNASGGCIECMRLCPAGK